MRSPIPPTATDRGSWTTQGLGIVALIVAMTVAASLLPSVDDETGAAAVDEPATEVEVASAAPSTAPPSTERPTAVASTPVTEPEPPEPESTEPEAAIATPPTSAAPEPEVPETSAPSTSLAETASTPASTSVTAPPTTQPEQASLSPDAPPSDPDAAPVVFIQTVPAVRNLIMRVDGRTLATNAEGAVALTADEADAVVEVVGLAAEPSIERVALVQWSDGSRELERSMLGAPGPVLQIGLEVRNRVFVELAESAPAVETLRFVSTTGDELTIEVGSPAWVPRSRAVPAPDGSMVAEMVEFRLEPGDDALMAATYAAEPEATWVVEGG